MGRPTVLTVVVTHNAPDALRTCLAAVASQSRRPDRVMVVDNASRPPAAESFTGASAGSEVPVEWIREASNTGPAGGYARGLGAFADSPYDLAWVMDDDAVPDRDCLGRLLAAAEDGPAPVYLFPLWVQPDGAVTRFTAWCGLLIDRRIVEAVGVPRADFFWWAEDTEYLMWRIPQAGYPVRHVEEAVVHHSQVRRLWGNPPWKYYYEARNTIYYDLHLRRRVRRLPLKLCLLVLRAATRERTRRLRTLGMLLRGVADGLRGQMGRTVPPDSGGYTV